MVGDARLGPSVGRSKIAQNPAISAKPSRIEAPNSESLSKRQKRGRKMSDPESDTSRASIAELATLGRKAAAAPPAPLRHLHGPASSIGFVGLGRMGSAMAINLMRSGVKVVANTRRRETATELAALGLEASTDISKLRDCTIVVTSLPDDDAVREVVSGGEGDRTGLLDLLGPGAIHLSTSTISPGAASEFALEHVLRGQGYVAAPVLGNPDAARARQLYILAAGMADDVDRCQPIFDVIGQRTLRVGTDPADANLIKLAANVLTAVTMETLGEVLALMRKRGLDPLQVMSVLTQTLHDGRVHRIYGGKIAAANYTSGGFVLPLALKDIRLALAEAERAGVPMPAAGIARDRLMAGIALGHADLDWSALGLVAAEKAGLSPQPPLQPQPDP
jgi:3-hydroxyisobutyrate dehydrogenase-like beta-hydroxyacid dehydrogenase